MRLRQELIELFSTFLQFKSDQMTTWVADGQLRRRMQRCIEQSAELSSAQTEQFWALYWHRQWQQEQSRLVELHLVAYLQEPCYWAAYQTLKKFLSAQYQLPDYFQMAIAEFHTVLKGYNADRGASLKTYAGLVFPSVLRDLLRQRQEADLCTAWALLRKVSKKRFLEALQWAGVAEAMVGRYRLAWTCFRSVCVPTGPTEKLPAVDRALWEGVADLYNRERLQLSPPVPAATTDQMEQWLTASAGWVRSYLYPPVDSLNVPQPGHESGERQDDLSTGADTSLLKQLIEEEEDQIRRNQHRQLQTVLTEAMGRLDAQSQTILQLYYREGLSQPQMIQRTGLSQPTVSRRLTKARESLLKALLDWAQVNADASLNSAPTSAQIKIMSNALEEWLKIHYGEAGLASTTGAE